MTFDGFTNVLTQLHVLDYDAVALMKATVNSATKKSIFTPRALMLVEKAARSDTNVDGGASAFARELQNTGDPRNLLDVIMAARSSAMQLPVLAEKIEDALVKCFFDKSHTAVEEKTKLDVFEKLQEDKDHLAELYKKISRELKLDTLPKLFVSYPWGDDKIKDDVRQAVRKLQAKWQFNIWIDYKRMQTDDIKKQMEENVKAADLVLIFFNHDHYQLSENCKLEATTAKANGKKMLFVNMEKKGVAVKIEDWFNTIIGGDWYLSYYTIDNPDGELLEKIKYKLSQ